VYGSGLRDVVLQTSPVGANVSTVVMLGRGDDGGHGTLSGLFLRVRLFALGKTHETRLTNIGGPCRSYPLFFLPFHYSCVCEKNTLVILHALQCIHFGNRRAAIWTRLLPGHP
jgi:hypothetical protein